MRHALSWCPPVPACIKPRIEDGVNLCAFLHTCTMRYMATVYIGLGSNLGHSEANLEHAMRLFKPEFRIRKASAMYETDKLYRPGKPRCLNICLRVETNLSPESAFEKCQMIEKAMGRRKSAKNEPRVIDVDLLLYDSVVLRTDTLIIPHPRMHERAFALVPLSAIAGGVIHPVIKKSIASLVTALGDYSHKIVKIDQAV